MSRTTGPTDRQRQVMEAVHDHGSIDAAATALKLSRVTVETTLARYHTAVCDRRIEELEAEVERLRERDAARLTTSRLEVVVGRLEKLAAPVNHLRLADGGKRVKDQRRELAVSRAEPESDRSSRHGNGSAPQVPHPGRAPIEGRRQLG